MRKTISKTMRETLRYCLPVMLFLGSVNYAEAQDKPPKIGPVEEKNIVKGKAQIHDEMGYILLHGDVRQQGLFLKTPTAEDREIHQADWQEAFEKAHKKWSKKMARYPGKVRMAKKLGNEIPEEPIEPTPENFEIDPLTLRNRVSFGPQFVFNKKASDGSKQFTYVMQVEPGEYTYFGPVFINPNGGYFGSCVCMGSVRFEVAAGVITNLGDVLYQSQMREENVLFDHDLPAIPDANASFDLAAADFSVPSSLSAYRTETADLRASRKFDNYLGVIVDRMMPIEGVLAYDRDLPIDVKARQEAEQTEIEVNPADQDEFQEPGIGSDEAVEAAPADSDQDGPVDASDNDPKGDEPAGISLH